MNTDALREQLKVDEGLRLKPYTDDTGHVTIGYGHNLTDVGITMEQAEALLGYDIQRTLDDLDKFLPWWRDLDEVRQQALANMAFNLGVDPSCTPPGYLTTFTTSLKLIRTGLYEQAADALLTKTLWARQVGVRATRITEMIRKGTP